jgi:hypothetical protein
MSTKPKAAVYLLLLLALIVACTDNDRVQAAKQSDGVESFKYERPDMRKYIKKESENLSSPKTETHEPAGAEEKPREPQRAPSRKK